MQWSCKAIVKQTSDENGFNQSPSETKPDCDISEPENLKDNSLNANPTNHSPRPGSPQPRSSRTPKPTDKPSAPQLHQISKSKDSPEVTNIEPTQIRESVSPVKRQSSQVQYARLNCRIASSVLPTVVKSAYAKIVLGPQEVNTTTRPSTGQENITIWNQDFPMSVALSPSCPNIVYPPVVKVFVYSVDTKSSTEQLLLRATVPIQDLPRGTPRHIILQAPNSPVKVLLILTAEGFGNTGQSSAPILPQIEYFPPVDNRPKLNPQLPIRPSTPTSTSSWSKNVTRYEGDMKNGVKHGNGCGRFVNGDYWEGQWENDEMYGEGRYVSSEGYIYNGCIMNNQRTGFGILEDANGCYEGLWLNNEKHGNGRQMYSDGSCYIGEWAVGHKHGHGQFQHHNGNTYNGHWENDNMTGLGHLIYNDGSEYKGLYYNNHRHGLGCFIDSNTNEIYLGEWNMDSRQGHGLLLGNGYQYTGTWNNNIRHGHGIVQDNEGLWEVVYNEGELLSITQLESNPNFPWPTFLQPLRKLLGDDYIKSIISRGDRTDDAPTNNVEHSSPHSHHRPVLQGVDTPRRVPPPSHPKYVNPPSHDTTHFSPHIDYPASPSSPPRRPMNRAPPPPNTPRLVSPNSYSMPISKPSAGTFACPYPTSPSTPDPTPNTNSGTVTPLQAPTHQDSPSNNITHQRRYSKSLCSSEGMMTPPNNTPSHPLANRYSSPSQYSSPSSPLGHLHVQASVSIKDIYNMNIRNQYQKQKHRPGPIMEHSPH